MATSYSALKLYAQCPTKYRLERILKATPNQPADNTAANRGSMVHSMIEAHIKGQLEVLPSELYALKKELDALKDNHHAQPELALGVTAEQTACDFEDPGALFRGIVDLFILDKPRRRARVRDWKTGKIRDYSGQLQFYAMLVFCNYDVDRVDTDIGFTDHGKIKPGPIVMRGELPAIWKAQMRSLEIIANDRVFAPNPSELCAFCPWQKKKGGPCKF